MSVFNIPPPPPLTGPTRSEPCGRYGSSGTRKDGQPRKRNQYPGACCFCGRALAAGEGCVERSNGRWVVFCLAPLEPLRFVSVADLCREPDR